MGPDAGAPHDYARCPPSQGCASLSLIHSVRTCVCVRGGAPLLRCSQRAVGASCGGSADLCVLSPPFSRLLCSEW